MSSSQGFEISPGWKGILAMSGVCHEQALSRAGLPKTLLDTHGTRVPASDFIAFARAIEELIDDPHFAIRLIDAMRPDFFSPTLFAALCSPNFETAIERVAQFKPLLAPIRLDVTREADELVLTYHWMVDGDAPTWLSGTEAMFITKLARLGTHHEIKPTSVCLPTLPEDPGPYEEFVGTRFEQGPMLEIRFSTEDTRRPFLTSNHAMWEIFEPSLRKRLAELTDSATFEERTHSALLECLPSGQTSIETVARRLAVSARTLQRRLKEEGTTYQAVVKTTRKSLANHYLSKSRLSASEIAYLLGFEEPSSFFRAFQEWTGTTPEAMRNELKTA